MDYYRKPINKVANDVKLKMQLGILTLKLSENNKKIDDLIKVDKNIKKDISSNSGLISTNESAISTNSEQINDIKSILPTSEIFKKTYGITNQSFQFTRNIVYFKLLEIEIENNFNKDGRLEFDNYIYYKYDNLQKDHHRLQHEYQIYDDKNNLLYKKILNKTNTSDLDFDKNIMLVKDNFYVTFKNNYNKITILLYLFRVYRHGTGNFNLELINENFVNVSYLDKNDISLKIDTNARDISTNLSKIDVNKDDIATNLIKINSNKDDILYNSTEIDYLKNNMSKSYLKNIYNILFYDYKKQINFNEPFFNKTFNLNVKKNDFIEIDLKMKLEYEDIDDSKIIKTEIKLYNDINEEIFISNYINKDSISYSNFVFLNKNILYNFIEDTKFLKIIIKFEFLQIKSIKKIHYIPTNNDRLYLKHYGN